MITVFITLSKKKTTAKKQHVEVAPVSIPQEEEIKLKSVSKHSKIGLSVDGSNDVLIRLSQCCQPIPGDDVVGFITRGRGITVHKKSCPSLKHLRNEKERLININWEGSGASLYPVKVAVYGIDRHGLLKDIADEIALSKTNIIKAEAQLSDKNNAVFKFILEVKGNDHLNEVINRLKKIKNITDVYKVNEKVVLK